jgi:hypothetical protein
MPRRNVRLLIGLAALVLIAALAAVLLFADLGGDRNQRAQPPQPTTQPAPTTTSLPVLTTTSTTIAGVVSTGQGPSAFTTTTAPGPIQVIVEGAACVRFIGDGWRVRYWIVNRGPAATGPVVGRIDDGEPTVLEESLRLGRGQTHEATRIVLGGGDAIIVTWVTTPEGGTSSFPIETPGCPPTPPTSARPARSPPPSLSPEQLPAQAERIPLDQTARRCLTVVRTSRAAGNERRDSPQSSLPQRWEACEHGWSDQSLPSARWL